jgi:hypothetical protein
VFLDMLAAAGFAEVKCHGETGFMSSPATMGMLFRAEKP